MPAAKPITRDAVDRGYNNHAAVPDHPYWLHQFSARSESAIEALRPARDIRYGPGPKETLDLFLPDAPARGTFLFIHGGYWRALDKSQHAFVAPPFVTAGLAVAVINYDLCPHVTVTTIIEQCRRAAAWLAREGPRRGATAPLVVGGHSAGGHLTAMLFATDWRAAGLDQTPFVGGISLSGLHDLEPILQFSYNVDIRLDDAEARRISPVNCVPTTGAPLVLAVGADETSEFLRQTRLLWDSWPRNRPAGLQPPMQIADRHHFSVVLDYADPGSALTQATLALFPR